MNKIYFFLDPKEKLLEVLKTKSIAQYAKEIAASIGNPNMYKTLHSCITWRVNRWFTPEEKLLVVRERAKKRSK